jgi:hypothetical protein
MDGGVSAGGCNVDATRFAVGALGGGDHFGLAQVDAIGHDASGGQGALNGLRALLGQFGVGIGVAWWNPQNRDSATLTSGWAFR